MLSVFGDESHDETRQRVFAVGALLGDAKQWGGLEQRWRELTNGRVFHAADCESRRGEFRDLSDEQCQRLHRDLTRILAESGLIGWGAAVDIAGAKSAFPESRPDQPYVSCFIRTIKFLAGKAYICIPRDKVEFTFDQNPETQYNAGLLYQHMIVSDEWTGDTLFAEKISFASRKCVGIQAADLWARELMKRFDSFTFNNRTIPRQQWKTLRGTDRFGADFICAGYFDDLKNRYESISADLGMKQGAYRAWLDKTHRQDNQSNRIQYTMQVDAEKGTGKTQEAL
jgi:hypothetical protein